MKLRENVLRLSVRRRFYDGSSGYLVLSMPGTVTRESMNLWQNAVRQLAVVAGNSIPRRLRIKALLSREVSENAQQAKEDLEYF